MHSGGPIGRSRLHRGRLIAIAGLLALIVAACGGADGGLRVGTGGSTTTTAPGTTTTARGTTTTRGVTTTTWETDCPDDPGNFSLWDSGDDATRDRILGEDLRCASFVGANLALIDLSGRNLYRADFSGANLWGANLSGAFLMEANLSGASLARADLRGADLGSFTGVPGLHGAHLDRAVLDAMPQALAFFASQAQSGNVPEVDSSLLEAASRCRTGYRDLRGQDLSGADLRD